MPLQNTGTNGRGKSFNLIIERKFQMRKIMWIVLIMAFVFTGLSFVMAEGSHAAEWHSNQGMNFLTDRQYQMKRMVIMCVNLKGGDKEKAMECVTKEMDAYDGLIEAIAITEMFAQDPELQDPILQSAIQDTIMCIGTAINENWSSKYNTADWTGVQKESIQCLDKIMNKKEYN